MAAAHKVKKQMLGTFLVAAIIPILIVGLLSVSSIRRQMTEHYKEQLHAEASRVNAIFFDVTTALYSSSENVLSTKSCMELFGAEEPAGASNQYRQVTSALALLHQNTAALSGLMVYTDNPNVPDNEYITGVDRYDGLAWYEALSSPEWDQWVCTGDLKDVPLTRDNQSYYALTLVRRIGVISRDYTAYLVLQADNSYLRNRIELNEYDITAAVGGFPIVYSSDRSRIEEDFFFPEDYEGGHYSYNGILTFEGEKMPCAIASFQPYRTGSWFYVSVRAADAYASINRMSALFCLAIGIALLVPTLLILAFSTYFSSRVNTLKNAMHQASEGDYNIIDSLKGDDELSEAFTDLTRTVEQIHEKEAAIYEAQIAEQKLLGQQQEMAYKMLASQINPHFLYNTLETIRMQALAAGNRQVAGSIKLLGRAMRYVLENTGTDATTLKKELDYVNTYLAIQSLRFGERISYRFEVAEGLDTENYAILPLLLQPVVENAIVHGLEPRDGPGEVAIFISVEDNILWIRVRDNGVGMDEQTLASVRERIKNHDPADSHSIGLYNIWQRIRLYYGEEYGMDFESGAGSGVTVTLRLPAQTLYEE